MSFKETLKGILDYMFSRMILYMTLVNFILLVINTYQSTEFGEQIREYITAPGDFVIIVLFIMLVISATEFFLLRKHEKEA